MTVLILKVPGLTHSEKDEQGGGKARIEKFRQSIKDQLPRNVTLLMIDKEIDVDIIEDRP